MVEGPDVHSELLLTFDDDPNHQLIAPIVSAS